MKGYPSTREQLFGMALCSKAMNSALGPKAAISFCRVEISYHLMMKCNYPKKVDRPSCIGLVFLIQCSGYNAGM